MRLPVSVLKIKIIMDNGKEFTRKPVIAALDDDAVIRKYISLALEHEGELVFSETIAALKEKLGHVRPDIFLLDVNLPDGDGIELCIELKKDLRFADSFFIILTSQTDNSRIERAYSVGADEFIRKPFVSFELIAKIRIIAHIISVRENLKNAYQLQLDQNVQLFRLSDFIKKSLSFKDTEAVLRNSEALADIVDLDYIEVIKVRNGVPLSIVQKEKSKKTGFVSFREIQKMGHIFNNIEKEIRYFHYRKGGNGIYNCVFAMRCNNAVYGYVLIQRRENFSQNDREVISMYLDCMNILNDSLSMQNELKLKNSQYRKEIDLIRKLEVSRLPDFSFIRGYDIGFAFMPAQDLSGDFFDGFLLDEDIYQIVLCDVSGHGIASSYVGTQIRTLFREKSSPGKKPSEILKEVNNELFIALKDMHYYCTAQIVQIYYDSGTILFVSAGHPEAVMYRKPEEAVSSVINRNPVVGMFSDEVYTDEMIRMESGDFLFLYTDGLVEEHDAEMQEMFGLDRLKESLIPAAGLSSSTEIVQLCLGRFYEFNGYRPQNDDITLICIRKL